MDEAAKYFVDNLLSIDKEAVGIFPKNEESDEFNECVSKLIVRCVDDFEKLKAEESDKKT